MSKIDPKWIQIDDSKLTIVENQDGENELSISTDAVLDGVSVELINGSKIEVRTASEGVPSEDPNRDQSDDIWIEIPDFA